MEYETSTENKLIEYGNTVKSKVRLAEGAKVWYLSRHGRQMPHALQMIVDSSWGTSGEILNTAVELQDKVNYLNKKIEILEECVSRFEKVIVKSINEDEQDALTTHKVIEAPAMADGEDYNKSGSKYVGD